MGVRLVKYGQWKAPEGSGVDSHELLLNRDLPNQHPIESITDLRETLDSLNVVDNIKDTNSVDITYEESTNTLSADVKIYNSEDNAITQKLTGLFVDKYLDIETEDTETIHLTVEGKGETLRTMFNTGTRFSHKGSWNNIANAAEANAWYFNETLDSFVQPRNTNTFTGFISTVKYRTYTHRVTLRSNDADDDANGLIIGYVVDDEGKPHTLSYVVYKGNNGNANGYYLYYDYMLPDEQLIASCGNLPGGIKPLYWNKTRGWNQVTNGITMQVSKAGSTIECACSNWNEKDINPKTTIIIDLDDYPWGYMFKGRVRYGYCNQSQAQSYFTDIYFSGKGPLKGNVILSPDDNNGLEIRDNGLYCKGVNSDDNSSGNQINITQQLHNLQLGDVVYLKQDGLYDKAFGEDSDRIEVVGIVTNIIDDDNFVITTSGEFKTDLYNNYSNGTVLYLSDSVSGTLTDNPVNYIKPIAIKINTGILINIQRANIYSLDTPNIEHYTEDEIINAVNSLW